MNLRTLAKKSLKRRGYELHAESRACTVLKDPFSDQKKLLPQHEEKIIFDVGANTGQTTKKYRALFPRSVIFSFEPHVESFDALSMTFAEDKAVYPVRSALSDKSGRRRFYVNESSLTNSLLPSVDITLARNLRTERVPVTTIDEFCKKQAIETVDILKMDIQGGELLALEGAHESLEKAAISLIYAEVLFAPQYEQQALFAQIIAFLSTYEYVLFDLYNLKHKQNGQLAWGDALFLGPRIGDAINRATF